jgi:anti-sigma regulatory factor (Ser/Thr protein kinase)
MTMSVPSHQTSNIVVKDASAVGHARRIAVGLGENVGLDEIKRGQLALIVTELGTNLLQHAGGGELLIRGLAKDEGGVEILAIDKGPGMANLAQCLVDGYSTGGSRGVGLGSVVRLADRFDAYSRLGAGAAVLATCLCPGARAPSRVELGVVCVPYPGEEVCGDGWAFEANDDHLDLLVVDGLGHGSPAAEAALVAIRAFESDSTRSPPAHLEAIHHRLSKSRGAAGALARIEWAARTVRFVGVGNVSGAIVGAGGSRGLSSHNGILGQRDPRFQEFTYAWPTDGILVLHSDGLSAKWNLDAYPGLAVKCPELVAAVLYRDFLRRDDASVLVAKARAAGGSS